MATTLLNKAEISYWKNEFERCKALREPYERTWFLNLAFYSGKQYVTWNPTVSSNLSIQRLVEPPAPRYRVRLVANKIKPAIRRELTKLTKEEPHFYINPATPEPNDVSAARAGETIAEFLLDDLRYNRVRRQTTFWMLICGVSFFKTYIMPEQKTGEMDFENNLKLDLITPFHLYVPNIQYENIEDQPYIIHVRASTPDEVYSQWGVVVQPSTSASGGVLEQKYLNALGIRTQGTDATPNTVYLKEIWIKPCKKYPNGGMLVFADDTLVYAYKEEDDAEETPNLEINPQLNKEEFTETQFPFEHGMYPFDKIEHIPSGSFYATSVIEDLIPLQKEYNKSRSQVVESKNRTAKPQLTYQKGSLDPKKVTSEPGLMIPINPGFSEPKPLIQKPVDQYVFEDMDRTLKDMADLTAQYEVTNAGGAPPGVEAASAIAYLQEQNDSTLHHTVASIEEATASIGRKLLLLVQEFWTMDKITQVVSKNAEFEATMFKLADLESNCDLRVEAGSMAPKSRAAKQAFITGLMTDGVIPPEKGLRYLEMNETDQLYDELQAPFKAAQREDYRMNKDGVPLPTNIWDNTAAHLYQHGLYLMSQEFEMLDPQLQQLHIQHYQEHMDSQNPLGAMNGPNNPAGPTDSEQPGAPGESNPADAGGEPAA